jgi:hypothetical protein
VRVWVGATVAGPGSLTGGLGRIEWACLGDVTASSGLAGTGSRWVNGVPTWADYMAGISPREQTRWLVERENVTGMPNSGETQAK